MFVSPVSFAEEVMQIEETDKINQESSQETTEESSQESSEDSTAVIEPFRGDGNIDIDISPVNKDVLSGNSVLFELNVRVTGNSRVYNNVSIVIGLPENGELFTPLEDLKIADVVPEYDEENNQLIYTIDSLEAGDAEKLILEYKTENGLENGTQFVATAELDADEIDLEATPTFTEATVTVKSTMSKTVQKRYTQSETKAGTALARSPIRGDIGVWNLRFVIPKANVGQQFIEPGSEIIIQDRLPASLAYVSDNANGQYNAATRTVTWKFIAPSIEEQSESTSELFSANIVLKTEFIANISSKADVSNTMDTIVTERDGSVKTVSSTTKTTQIPGSNGNPTTGPTGSLVGPDTRGPRDGANNLGLGTNFNPNPTVAQDAKVAFSIYLTPISANSPNRAFVNYEAQYQIDNKLILQEVTSVNNLLYWPDFSYTSVLLTSEEAVAAAVSDDVYATVNGVERLILKNVKPGVVYDRSDWLAYTDKTQYVSKLRIKSVRRSAAIHTNYKFGFTIKPGATGRAVNRLAYDFTGYNAAGNQVRNVQTFTSGQEPTRMAGERYVTIASNTQTTSPPIISNTVRFLNNNAGVIEANADNRVRGTLNASSASPQRIQGPFSSYLLLPEGVHYKADDLDPKIDGTIELIDSNFNGTNRELVEILWNRTTPLNPGELLDFEFNVEVSKNTHSPVVPELYSYIGVDRFATPNYSSEAITNSIILSNQDNINGSGNQDQRLILTKNKYLIIRSDRFIARQMVKGELDESYSPFGFTTLGGSADFRLLLTNEGDTADDFILYDILPAIGDLGITDNNPTGSKFDPILTGPITLPDATKDEFEVFYSTSKKPSRNDLTQNVQWPSTTTPYQDPPGAENPNWKKESEITDWSTIKSFMVKSKPGMPINTQEVIQIDFNMKAPDTLDAALLDSTVSPFERAAWNSFAYTINNLQPIEPRKVGFAINQNAFNLKVFKEDKTTKERLSETEFTLYDQDKLVLNSIVTDENGEAFFENLEVGTYYVQETQAPEGYELNAKMYEIEISSTGEITIKNADNWIHSLTNAEPNDPTVSFTMDNQNRYKLPETGSSMVVLTTLFGFGMIISGSFYKFYLSN